MVHLITSSTARSLVNLTTMKIINCNSLEKVVAQERDGSEDEIAFSSLEILELVCLPMMKRFCSSKCVLNFPSLVKVIVEQCPRMSIFSVMDTSTPMLQHILSNEDDEKMYWEGDLNRTINKMFVDMVGFQSSKYLELSKYPELRELWYNNVQPKAFGNLKSLVVQKCDFLIDVLLPLNLVQALSNLEELQVSECDSLEAVFDLTNMDGNDVFVKKTIQLKKLILSGLRKLKYIWKQNSQEIETTEDRIQYEQVLCPNLQVVLVDDCVNLEYLFPYSIAMHAIQLAHVTIKKTWGMKQIVSDKEGIMNSRDKFVFNHLISLKLWHLPELEGFFAGNHNVLCPLLRELDVRDCRKLKLFKTQSTNGIGRVVDNELQIPMQHPLFKIEEVICNLETLALNSESASMILQRQLSREHFSKLKSLFLDRFEDDHATFPYWFLQNITTLNELLVEFSSFREIFQEGKFEAGMQLKILTLNQLQDLQHICKEGYQIDPVLEVLSVFLCSNLKHLVPSSVTFSHLTYLEVGNCNGMVHLITSSTARSLVNLTTMKIMECNSLGQVVAQGKEESADKIAFRSLQILELEALPMIKRFCSSKCVLNFPSLVKVIVEQCPRMSIFSVMDTSTPMLQKISSKEDGRVYWEGDLNRTINKMFVDMVAFSSSNHLELSKYPELKEIWYGQVGQKIFCNLKHLVVRKCSFLSNVLFPSNSLQLLSTLEDLEVAECDSLEAVFDVKALDDRAVESKQVSGLKKLTLSGLPNLKYIWNPEASEIISFGNLEILEVDKCPNLKYVFSPSLCQELRQLEELNIQYCGVEAIVANEEGFEELYFDFPLLRIFRLVRLNELNDFYPKRYLLECPSLKVLNVAHCEAVQIFAFGPLDTQQALFHIQKVSKNLDDLSLNEKDAMRILNGSYEEKLFQLVEMLRLQYFQESPMNFLNELLERFPSATTLQARWSSFDSLFPATEIGRCSIESPTQIKTLWLYQLEQLEHIWNGDNSASHPLVPNLEYLYIMDCCGLRRLAPPLTSFTNLTTLKAEDCNGLMYFMSPFTAKSLVHLTSLEVRNCGKLEEIVTTDEGGSQEEIIFKALKYLELTCLSSFKSFCFGKSSFIFPSLVRLIVKGCHKMQNFSSGVIVAPFLKLVEAENEKKRWTGDLNTTINQLYIEKTNENLNMDSTEASSSGKQVGESKPNEIEDTRKQETGKLQSESYNKEQNEEGTQDQKQDTIDQMFLVQTSELLNASRASSSEEHVGQTKTNQTADTEKQESRKHPSESYDREQNERPLAQVTQNTSSSSTNQDTEAPKPIDTTEALSSKEQVGESKGNQIASKQEKHKPPSLAWGTQEKGEKIERPSVDEVAKITGVHDADTDVVLTSLLVLGPIDANKASSSWEQVGESKPNQIAVDTHQNEQTSSASQAPELVTEKSGDSYIEIQNMHDTIKKPSSPTTSSPTIRDAGLARGSREMSENIDRPNVEDAKIVPSHPRHYNKAVGSQEICKTMDKPLIQTDQHAQILTTTQNTDPSPSKAPRPMTSTTLVESEADRDNKWLKYISKQNLPYLEFGVKRHPQVLDWFNKKQRGIFAAIFSEVTRILRTTQRCNLREDDQNYIKECCAALEAVDFDASWLSYVHGCIESSGDDEDEVMRKLEEAEAKASTLRNELASVEASLASLRDQASRLHSFIES